MNVNDIQPWSRRWAIPALAALVLGLAAGAGTMHYLGARALQSYRLREAFVVSSFALNTAASDLYTVEQSPRTSPSSKAATAMFQVMNLAEQTRVTGTLSTPGPAFTVKYGQALSAYWACLYNTWMVAGALASLRAKGPLSNTQQKEVAMAHSALAHVVDVLPEFRNAIAAGQSVSKYAAVFRAASTQLNLVLQAINQ